MPKEATLQKCCTYISWNADTNFVTEEMAKDKNDRHQYRLKQISMLKLESLQRNVPVIIGSTGNRVCNYDTMNSSRKQLKLSRKLSTEKINDSPGVSTNDGEVKLKVISLRLNNPDTEIVGSTTHDNFLKSRRYQARNGQNFAGNCEQTTTDSLIDILADCNSRDESVCEYLSNQATELHTSADRDKNSDFKNNTTVRTKDRDKNSNLRNKTTEKLYQTEISKDIQEKSARITTVNVGLEEIVFHSRKYRAGSQQQLRNPKFWRYYNNCDNLLNDKNTKDATVLVNETSNNTESVMLPNHLPKAYARYGYTANKSSKIAAVTPILFDPPVNHKLHGVDSKGSTIFSSTNSCSSVNDSSSGSSVKAVESDAAAYSQKTSCRSSSTQLKPVHLRVFSERKISGKASSVQASISSEMPGYKLDLTSHSPRNVQDTRQTFNNGSDATCRPIGRYSLQVLDQVMSK